MPGRSVTRQEASTLITQRTASGRFPTTITTYAVQLTTKAPVMQKKACTPAGSLSKFIWGPTMGASQGSDRGSSGPSTLQVINVEAAGSTTV